ncbi:MAG: hypothetical protein E6230_17810 [Paenibacillus dendritiformis]|uniref:hypothetical protein n=1 Tax=uncultured Paenibacillus sp. TaxID=227322 RepID=UPI0025F696AF|nr:hypothetical protein [uncultured Paenibacillus sp.]MDU5144026.1 hypothetical protein [Paenibacillus dendritiformis]
MDLSAKNVPINPGMVGAEETVPSEGVNVSLSADDTIVLLCEGSSIMMRGKNQEVHMRSDNVRLESPENPLDLQVMAAMPSESGSKPMNRRSSTTCPSSRPMAP